ncbi:MAG: peptidyl-prolyl cis-trans isomerase, partial [Deinococcales bacterium]
FKAQVGKVVGPVKTQYGYHVILVSKHTQASTKPFDQVKKDVESKLRQQHANSQVQALVKSSGVQTFPDRLPQPPKPSASTPSSSTPSSSTPSSTGSSGGTSSGGSGNTSGGSGN